MLAEEFFGIDVGEKRVGVARGSTVARLAEPMMVLPANKAMAKLKELVLQRKPAGLVVGLPRSLNGTETAQTAKVRAWANELGQKLKLPVYFQDEALTTQTALGRQASAKKPTAKAELDALAATVILQDFLDTAERDRIAV